MTATVDIADIERELDAEKAAKKGTVILDYEAMLAALDALLAENAKRDGRARHSGNFIDTQHGQEPETVPNAWIEAHAMLSKK